jgi:hypothetical protein
VTNLHCGGEALAPAGTMTGLARGEADIITSWIVMLAAPGSVTMKTTPDHVADPLAESDRFEVADSLDFPLTQTRPALQS